MAVAARDMEQTCYSVSLGNLHNSNSGLLVMAVAAM